MGSSKCNGAVTTFGTVINQSFGFTNLQVGLVRVLQVSQPDIRSGHSVLHPAECLLGESHPTDLFKHADRVTGPRLRGYGNHNIEV